MGQADTQTVRSIAQWHLNLLWPGRNKRLPIGVYEVSDDRSVSL